MLMAVLLAAGMVSGAPVAGLVLAAVAATHPVPFLVAAGAWAVVARVRSPGGPEDDESFFLLDLGGRLRSGASLRLALASASVEHPSLGLSRAGRLAAAGAPMPDVCGELADRLPVNGRQLGAAIEMATRSGGRLVPVVARLIESSQQRAEMKREHRLASVQARLSALVVGSAPLAFTGLLMVVGVVPAPWRAGGVLAAVVVVGIGLELIGLAVVVAILKRSGLKRSD